MSKELQMKLEAFKQELAEEEKKERTITQYMNYIYEFIDTTNIERLEDITKELLIDYKEYLKEKHPKESSINIKVIIINKFIMFVDLPDKLKLKQIKVQKKATLENVLNEKEYNRLLDWALKLNKNRMYYLMKTIRGTGIRISELKYITVEAVKKGNADFFNKGKKRPVPIKKSLQKDLKKYCEEADITEGIIFKSRQGNPLDDSYVWRQLQGIAGKARGGLSKDKVHPHSFRHLFAKDFIASGGDITTLADILGHESLETTRIYTRMTLAEQRALLNKMDRMKKQQQSA